MAKLLVVEDDADIRAAYVFEFTRAGFEVAQAEDGSQGVPVFEKMKPDVVLLDMLMPGMSGLDFLRALNVAKRFPQTKVIALSNIDTPRVIEQATQLGVTDYIIKVNMTPKDMVELVQQRLSGIGPAVKPGSPAPAVAPAPEASAAPAQPQEPAAQPAASDTPAPAEQ